MPDACTSHPCDLGVIRTKSVVPETKHASKRRRPSPRLRGEGWGEGQPRTPTSPRAPFPSTWLQERCADLPRKGWSPLRPLTPSLSPLKSGERDDTASAGQRSRFVIARRCQPVNG